jgi:hypothetical protein
MSAFTYAEFVKAAQTLPLGKKLLLNEGSLVVKANMSF